MTEILLILAVALVVIGPKKLPELARVLGRGLAEFRKATDDIQKTIYREIHKPLDPRQSVGDLDPTQTQVKPGAPPGEKPVDSASKDRPATADDLSPQRGEEGKG